ncbi:prepilin-type N-terminal cleavage/methylation domain-containing protein [Thioalkalivibrio sp. ALE9]|uniref:prepilin-type N-terminal cleavage/methylation domain-containing protein n=1 Tax=Thioalkalivibrio sp. ALE9 TaxID=1158169 RepID=UPI000374C5A1|nr:prepilin-type N-terminal cleavage/methylation domain-containing protein [Thioalkalivibrio sp. ALE9]
MATRSNRASGFTLIELLVVMFVIGVVASVGVLSMSQLGSRNLEQTARQLASQIELAREHTLLTGQALSIGVGTEGLVILERQWIDDTRVTWIPIERGPLGPHDFRQHGLQPRLYVDGRRSGLRESPEHNRIAINGSGHIEPFELILEHPDGRSGFVLRLERGQPLQAFEHPPPAGGEPRRLLAKRPGRPDSR